MDVKGDGKKSPENQKTWVPGPVLPRRGSNSHSKSFNLVGLSFLICKLKQLNWLTCKVSTVQN